MDLVGLVQVVSGCIGGLPVEKSGQFRIFEGIQIPSGVYIPYLNGVLILIGAIESAVQILIFIDADQQQLVGDAHG